MCCRSLKSRFCLDSRCSARLSRRQSQSTIGCAGFPRSPQGFWLPVYPHPQNDPIISKVASQLELSQPQLHLLLPSELTLFVDGTLQSPTASKRMGPSVFCTGTPAPASYGAPRLQGPNAAGPEQPPLPTKNYVMAFSILEPALSNRPLQYLNLGTVF